MMATKNSFCAGQTNEKGRQVCGAKTRRGTPCRETKLYPNGRCYHHGGPTPLGVASPHFKHGRYSKCFPKGLLDRYKGELADPAAREVMDELAALGARTMQVFEKLGTGEGPSAWVMVREAFDMLTDAIQTPNVEKLRQSRALLSAALEHDESEGEVWAELVFLFNERGKLVERQSRIEERAQRVVTSQEMAVLIAALLDLIGQHVRDKDALAAIMLGVENLISQRGADASQPLN